MQLSWLKQGGSSEVIVIFGGWAIGPQVFAQLQGGQDLLFVSDYRNLETELADLSDYAKRSLVAWSFGVASYGHWQAGRADPFERKVAVNGSLTPVCRATGIPPVILQKTIDSLSPEAYQLFVARVFGARQPVATIDVNARRAELVAVQARGAAPDPGFKHIWISSQDKIFPPANLARAWSGQCTQMRDAPHMPFDGFNSWQEVLR